MEIPIIFVFPLAALIVVGIILLIKIVFDLFKRKPHDKT